MEVKIENKVFVTDKGEHIAYVEVVLDDGKYTYKVKFDEKTKKRFNRWASANGYAVGLLKTDEPEGDNVWLSV